MAKGSGDSVHSRLSQGDMALRPWPVMNRRSTEGAGTPSPSESSVPMDPAGMEVMSRRNHRHLLSTASPMLDAPASHRSRHGASISTPTHRHPYLAAASCRMRPSPHPRSHSTLEALSLAAAKTCGSLLAAHGANGETDLGPACDHGSSTYSSLVSTYRLASSDCSASHRSRLSWAVPDDGSSTEVAMCRGADRVRRPAIHCGSFSPSIESDREKTDQLTKIPKSSTGTFSRSSMTS
mmetsp:Transcript_3363/g.15294  ORF Transcript_3363/g.15294 Transcript_3363/m.15294 type:complete len:237 (-) Transcript_3363:5655-6365(-)